MDTGGVRSKRKPEPGRRPRKPAGQTGRKPGDARGDPDQQARNREDLDVDENHMTKDMNRGRRGTFP